MRTLEIEVDAELYDKLAGVANDIDNGEPPPPTPEVAAAYLLQRAIEEWDGEE